MRRAILVYAAVAVGLLWALDRVWPIWPLHVVASLAALLVVVLAVLAWVAAGRRMGRK
jgi:hypothetical protein